MGSNLWDGVARVGKGWVREGNFKFFYYVYTGVRVGSWVGWHGGRGWGGGYIVLNLLSCLQKT